MDIGVTKDVTQEKQSSQDVQHAHGRRLHHIDTQADIASAKLAWEAWQSNDPNRINSALAERHRLLKEDPKAWKKAMHELDEQADVASAKSVWADWKSGDPQLVDHAISERHRLLKQDPKAWKMAMGEIDEDKRRAEAEAQLQGEIEAEQAAQVAPPKQLQEAQQTILPTITLSRPADMPPGAVTQPYAPEGTAVVN